MAQKGLIYTFPFTTDDGNWTLNNAQISGGVLDITANNGYGRRSPDADWYIGSTNNFILNVDFKQDFLPANQGVFLIIKLVGDAQTIRFDHFLPPPDTRGCRIVYNSAQRASTSYTMDTNWHTAKIRRVGTTYYFRFDTATEVSWDYGTEREIEYIVLQMVNCTGDYDNFKYSWIKAVLEGVISFSGDINRKLSLKRTLEGSISFIGTLQRKLSLKRLFEGNVSFIGTLKIRRLWNAISKRSNVWTPQDKRDNDWTKE